MGGKIKESASKALDLWALFDQVLLRVMVGDEE